MNSYELLFIIASALDEEKKQATIETVQGIVEAGKGEVSKVDVWGTKRLAYPIQKKNDGYYVLVDFKAPTDLPYELDRRLKISDAVIRHIIINKDEDQDIAS
jgi:small subunit ribosomal protein S6